MKFRYLTIIFVVIISTLLITEWRLHRITIIPDAKEVSESIIADSIGLLCVEEIYIADDLNTIEDTCIKWGMEKQMYPAFYSFAYNKKQNGFLTITSREVYGVLIDSDKVLKSFMSRSEAKSLSTPPKIGDKIVYHYYLSGHIFRKWITRLIKTFS